MSPVSLPAADLSRGQNKAPTVTDIRLQNMPLTGSVVYDSLPTRNAHGENETTNTAGCDTLIGLDAEAQVTFSFFQPLRLQNGVS